MNYIDFYLSLVRGRGKISSRDRPGGKSSGKKKKRSEGDDDDPEGDELAEMYGTRLFQPDQSQVRIDLVCKFQVTEFRLFSEGCGGNKSECKSRTGPGLT